MRHHLVAAPLWLSALTPVLAEIEKDLQNEKLYPAADFPQAIPAGKQGEIQCGNTVRKHSALTLKNRQAARLVPFACADELITCFMRIIFIFSRYS